jgi:hypothetical protein
MLPGEFESDELFGECDPIGEPVFQDLEGRKYFGGVVVHNLVVKIGDCVRVLLESEDDNGGGFIGGGGGDDEAGDVTTAHAGDGKKKKKKNSTAAKEEMVKNFGYCQVFAIYDDPDPDRGVLFEARWFSEPEEVLSAVDAKKKRMYVGCCLGAFV